jgi:hypothetical protein
MSTLAEVEAAVTTFSIDELEKLEGLIRRQRRERTGKDGRSPLDLPPIRLGEMLKPLGSRDEWHDEMLEGRV